MKAFANYHPFVLMLYFLSVLVIAMFVTNPVLQGLALLGGLLFCAMLLRRREWLSNLGFYLLMFLMAAVSNPLFSHNGVTPLFFLNGNPVTLEAIIYGIAIGVMIIAVMLWCQCYSYIMTSDKFLYLFGKAIPKLSLVLSMALCFVPQFKKQMHKVSRTQKAMGLYAGKSYTDKVRSAMRIFMAMISWSLENAMETSSSMKARGYGLKGRTNFSLFRFYPHDGWMLSACIALLGTTLLGLFTGYTDFYYYPRITQLPLTPMAVVVYMAFGSLSLLPFFIEVKEALVWKYYISKI